MASFTCYAKAVKAVRDRKGNQYLLCWIDGDEPPKSDPMQQRIPPAQRIMPVPVPLKVIRPESEVHEEGDEGKLVVIRAWACARGLEHEEAEEVGGIFRQ